MTDWDLMLLRHLKKLKGWNDDYGWNPEKLPFKPFSIYRKNKT
jgi:hypothetical protein